MNASQSISSMAECENSLRYTDQDLENLRLKFRKEALKACEEAEKKGFKRGSESINSNLR